MDRRHMKRIGAFVLKLAVLDNSTVLGNQFSHCIGKVRSLSQAEVALKDGHLAVFFCNDEITRIDRRSDFFAAGHVDNVNWLLDGFASRNMNESPIQEKRRVKRSKRIVLSLSIAPQMPLEKIRLSLQGRSQAAGFDPRWGGGRKIGRQMAIHEHQP